MTTIQFSEADALVRMLTDGAMHVESEGSNVYLVAPYHRGKTSLLPY